MGAGIAAAVGMSWAEVVVVVDVGGIVGGMVVGVVVPAVVVVVPVLGVPCVVTVVVVGGELGVVTVTVELPEGVEPEGLVPCGDPLCVLSANEAPASVVVASMVALTIKSL